MSEMVIYQAETGDSVTVRLDGESLWLTQEQIAELFGRDRLVITKHLRNIFKEEELDRDATCAKFAQVQIEGDREVSRGLEYYNLETMISVGYLPNAVRGSVSGRLRAAGSISRMVGDWIGYA